MSVRSLIVPGLVFFAGAVFGRLFGVKPLLRGAMAVATMSGAIPETSERRHRRVSHRPARRRAPRRSSKAA
jgi:hypothetical protein